MAGDKLEIFGYNFFNGSWKACWISSSTDTDTTDEYPQRFIEDGWSSIFCEAE